ncbi:MAG: AAA family ATPase [Chloroflexota bacterium]
MIKKVLYSAGSFFELRQKNGYFVDKTKYIAKVEGISNPIFLRPRRFGKSFLCSILHSYYDIAQKDDFEELFGDTWIGQNPTGQQNQFMVLKLSFSGIESGPTLAEIETSFKEKCNGEIENLRLAYAPLLDAMPPIDVNAPVSQNLAMLTRHIRGKKLPRLFVIIDEYDNFANQLIVKNQTAMYDKLVDEGSFLKTFFKELKEGRQTRGIENVFITGILPMTIDELASAFNVGSFLTLRPSFETMVGFTQAEVDALLDEIFEDYAFLRNAPDNMRSVVGELIKNNYNGYHFVKTGEGSEQTAVYNTTILMYFLNHLVEEEEITVHLTDENLKTDIGWMERLRVANAEEAEAMVNQLAIGETISYNNYALTNKFNVNKFFDKRFFPNALFYLGLLTRQDDFSLSFPNLNMYQVFLEYFNDYNKLDMTNPYKEALMAFVRDPDLNALFAAYWEAYIQHLPEAVFTKMNENFYRTTFYHVCMQHLSRYFIWNVERSYPEGKSDLEFIGKHNEKFAGIRWVIEFKYYSNTGIKQKLSTDKITLDKFEVQEGDLDQIQGYVQGLAREYPEAKVSQFVIYCFGNQDFRVFAV